MIVPRRLFGGIRWMERNVDSDLEKLRSGLCWTLLKLILRSRRADFEVSGKAKRGKREKIILMPTLVMLHHVSLT